MTDANIITPEENQMTSKDFQRIEVGAVFTTKQMIEQSNKIEQNIESVIAMATPEEYEAGLDWYYLASVQCKAIAERYGLTYSAVVGIVAGLSPGVQWEKNLLDAIAVIEVGAEAVCSTYKPNKAKAVSIAADGDVSVLGGSKVTAFYANILNPHLDQHVTCDRHAATAACNWYKEFDGQKFLRDAKYTVLENAYFAVARKLGMQGHQAQAIAWVAAKRLFSNKKDVAYDMPEWLPMTTD